MRQAETTNTTSARPRPLRVLHCPTNVGGHPAVLAAAERAIGLDSRAVEFHGHPLGYPIDERLWDPGDGLLTRERKRWRFIRRALRDFDAVHFNFGRTMLPERHPLTSPDLKKLPLPLRLAHQLYAAVFEQRDLRWLRRAGKRVVVTYQGDDARQGDYCRDHFAVSVAQAVPAGYYPAGSDDHKRRRIARVARHADRIFALNPDLLRVLPAGSEFLPYAHVDPRQWTAAAPVQAHGGPPVVVHAPTHRGAKGTAHVIEAVERLRREDRLDFEFILVENLPHAQARAVYQRADLLVDQLFAGWYGGLAVELMALGRPVIAYVRQEDLQFVPQSFREELPIASATPGTVYEVMKDWLTAGRSRLIQQGIRCREFVERWHDPLTIARRTAEAYGAGPAPAADRRPTPRIRQSA
jgi:hypothetical protein